MYHDILFIVLIFLGFLVLSFVPFILHLKIYLENMRAEEKKQGTVAENILYVITVHILVLSVFVGLTFVLETITIQERFKPSYIATLLWGDGTKPLWELHWDTRQQNGGRPLYSSDNQLRDGGHLDKYTLSSSRLNEIAVHLSQAQSFMAKTRISPTENEFVKNWEKWASHAIKTVGLDYFSMVFFYFCLFSLPLFFILFVFYWFRIQEKKEDTVGIGNMPIMNFASFFMMNLGWIILVIVHSSISQIYVSAMLPHEAGTVAHNLYHSIQYLWGQILQPN